jgi:hypothetical protein
MTDVVSADPRTGRPVEAGHFDGVLVLPGGRR